MSYETVEVIRESIERTYSEVGRYPTEMSIPKGEYNALRKELRDLCLFETHYDPNDMSGIMFMGVLVKGY